MGNLQRGVFANYNKGGDESFIKQEADAIFV